MRQSVAKKARLQRWFVSSAVILAVGLLALSASPAFALVMHPGDDSLPARST